MLHYFQNNKKYNVKYAVLDFNIYLMLNLYNRYLKFNFNYKI